MSIGHTRWVAILFVAFCLLCAPATVLAQIQLGADIDGESAEDGSGTVSLSFDGNRLAIGAAGNDDNGSESGHARVYQWSGMSWTQLGADIDGEAGGDGSELVSLSSDGSRLAIGAPGNDGNGIGSGHVRVYEWSDSGWVQLGADIDGEAADDGSGLSVSLSSVGNRLAIGAPWSDDNSGHVRVYELSDSAWVQLGADIDGEATAQYTGFSVSLSSDGNRLAIGAPWSHGNGSYSGHARVYQWSGTAWTQLGADINGEAADDGAGWSVSLSSDGNRLAIGAPGNDGNGSESGHARVYQWSDMAWTQLGADIDGEAAGDRSELVSLSSDGNRLAIGAPRNDGNGIGSGHVRIYQWSGMAWTQLGTDIDGESAEDYSGVVALSSDGNNLAIGADGNDGNGDFSGHVRVFDLSMFNVFNINPGLNDAWYNRATSGQGFLLTVFPEIREMFVAWFTFDTQRPPEDVTAFLGEPGHRWLTAQGPYDGDTAELTIFVTEGGVFDAIEPVASTDLTGDGTLTIEFAGCNAGLVSYEITSLGISGEIPIERISLDNVPLCESLKAK